LRVRPDREVRMMAKKKVVKKKEPKKVKKGAKGKVCF